LVLFSYKHHKKWLPNAQKQTIQTFQTLFKGATNEYADDLLGTYIRKYEHQPAANLPVASARNKHTMLESGVDMQNIGFDKFTPRQNVRRTGVTRLLYSNPTEEPVNDLNGLYEEIRNIQEMLSVQVSQQTHASATLFRGDRGSSSSRNRA